ncbi:MAG: phage tail tape measure protein [Rhodospirillaceae bacterium]|nr:MAG: phage tail tape measure protein [Rhodospirillaceae bacterium]
MKLSVILEAVDKVTKPVRAIAARLRGLSAQLGLGRLAGAVGNVGKSFGQVASDAGAMAKRTVAAFGIVGAGLFGLVKSSADAGDSANDAAKKVGVGIVAYQRLGYAAKMSGSDQQTAGKGLGVLNKQVVEAAKGNKAAAAQFKALGISLKDAGGHLKPTEQIFGELADRFQEMPDGAKKSYIAAKLFGEEAGPALVQTLNNGSAGLKDLGDQAERLGRVIGQDAADASGDFNDSLDRMFDSLLGLRDAIGAKLMPVLTPLIGEITDLIVANRDLIATKLQDFIDALPDRIAEVRKTVADLYQRMQPLIKVFKGAIEYIGPMNSLLIAAGVVMGGKLALSVAQLTLAFGGLGKAILGTTYNLAKLALAPLISTVSAFILALRSGIGVVEAFNIALAANPIGLVITAVAALAAGIYLLYENWDTVGPWFTKLWEGVRNTFGDFVDWIKGSFVGDITAGFDAIWSKVGPIIDSLKQGFDWASSIGSKASSFFGFSGDDAGGSASFGAANVTVGARDRVDTGGVLKIEVTDRGARVTDMRPNDRRQSFEADRGMVMQ